MPQGKPFPSLLKHSALATCRLVKNAVRSDARVSEIERHLDEWNDVAVTRIDEKCAAIAEHLKSHLTRDLLSDLANVHLPKLCGPADSWSDRLNQTLEALYAMCAFLKCGLREVSFRKLLNATGGNLQATKKYSRRATCSLLLGILTSPEFFVNLKRLDLRKLEGLMIDDVDELVRGITRHGKELVHLNLGSMAVYNSTLDRFVPEKNERGAFVGPVPCPKLASLKAEIASEVYTGRIVDFLLSHPMLASFGCDKLGEALRELDKKVSEMPEAYGEWKSSLTHGQIVTDGRKITNETSSLDPDRISRFSVLFPNVTVLETSLPDSQLPKLIPLMERLAQLHLNLGSGDPLESNAVALLTGHGTNLTTLGITCLSLSVSQLKAIDQGCPNLNRLSLDFFMLTGKRAEGLVGFSLFDDLEEVALMIGRINGCCDEVHPRSLSDTLRILLKDKPLLEKFTLLTGINNVLTDDFVSEWVTGGWTPGLREVSFGRRLALFPSPGSFPLTDAALAKLVTLPKISRIGELEFWSIEESLVEARRKALEATGVDLEVV